MRRSIQKAVGITDIAGLLADGSRSTMLQALMDRRARTAGELARLAKIAPSTASQHLGRLTDGELLVVEAQGRHCYYRLADPRVAALLESMMAFAPAPAVPHAPKVGFDLRFARTCMTTSPERSQPRSTTGWQPTARCM